MSLPPPASTITLSSEPIVAAIQIVAVITYPAPKRAQRAVRILHAWHKQAAWAAELTRKPSGLSPARIEERLSAPEKLLERRFEAARWAVMLAAKATPIQIRFDSAPDPTVRALARWRDCDGEPNVIRDVWSASKPVLAMTLAIRGQFEHTPSLAELCFSSAWVGPAVDAAEGIAWWLDAIPGVEYRAADRVEFHVPNLISV